MRQSQNYLNAISVYSYRRYIRQTLVLVSFILLLTTISTHQAHANFESTDSSAVAACPANHKMYYIGANAPTATATFPVTAIPLEWNTGSSTGSFTFNETSGRKIFNINFSSIIEKNNSQGTPPFFGATTGSTSSAINLVHDSTSTVNNHVLDISTNRSVSKMGYKIQDVDSLTSRVIVGYFFGFPIYGDRTPYVEQVDVSANGGRLTFNSLFHTANNPAPNTSIVTAIQGRNCSTGECNIDASWNYKTANSILKLKHNNTLNETSAPHAVGYSDFYFCLAPPKIIVKKALNGARVNDTDAKRDQFEISVNENTNPPLGSFKTTGSGPTVTNGSSSAISLAENTSYTITEQVKNGETLGDIANYDATYTCNNATTGSTTVMPTTAMTYNATTKTRSFTLANTNYGDEITCTITNTPKSYTFSGTVFNDNGGITSPDAQLVGGIYNNANFFNGVFDTNESGIDGMDVVKARLSDCSNNPSANPIIATVNVTSLGKYIFAVSAKDLAGKTDLCIEEIEPTNWLYSVDTTPNIRKFSFDPSVLTYQTGVKINGNTLNLDFGNVIKENTALVLIKSQYVHDCSLTDLTTIGVNYSGLATTAYSKQPIADIEPGQCIAYRIEAINRGNVPLTDIIIRDTLQEKGKNGALVTSTLVNPAPIGENSNSGAPTFSTGSVAIGKTGTAITNPFILGASSSSNNRKAIRFNTKYGSISGN